MARACVQSIFVAIPKHKLGGVVSLYVEEHKGLVLKDRNREFRISKHAVFSLQLERFCTCPTQKAQSRCCLTVC